MSTSKNYKWVKLLNGKITVQHRVIMEKHLGRLLKTDEIVHHKDGNGKNNDIQNLELMSLSQHGKLHAKPKHFIELTCAYCGIKFSIKLSHYKYRIKKGHIDFYHNRSCAGKMKNPPHKESYSSTIKNKLELYNIIEEGLKNGLTGGKIAKNNGLNAQTVYTWIKKLYPDHPLRKNHTSDFIAIIQEGLQKGLTGAEIARNNNTSKSTVYRWIDTMGITK